MSLQKINNTCQVCNTQGSFGNHFGATSCRACAAFFRRTAFSKLTTSKCRGGSCNNDTFFCKPCRVQRCFEVGMKTENFQYNRDSLHSKVIPTSFSKFVGRPEMVLFCDPISTSTKPHKNYINVDNLVFRALQIFDLPSEMIHLTENQLEKLSIGLKVVRDFKVSDLTDCPRYIMVATQKEVADTWQHYFLTVARWLTHFDEFQKLEAGIKLQILQCVWHIWATLDRHSATAIHHKNHPNASKTEIVSRRGVLIDIAKVHFDATWLSDYPSRQISHFFRQGSSGNFNTIGALFELEPTDMELTYMLAQLSFEYAGKRCQGEILKICEKFQEILAGDLHNYYVEEMRMPNYSGRLARLMKINNSIQKNLWEHRPRMEVAKIFNIIKLEFSHPDMFLDSGFN